MVTVMTAVVLQTCTNVSKFVQHFDLSWLLILMPLF